jgi:hypothetical protein
MAKEVKGEVLLQNYELQLKFNEFQRQINQLDGYPFNFEELKFHLQKGIDGKFVEKRFFRNNFLKLLSEKLPIVIDKCSGEETFFNSKDFGFNHYSDLPNTNREFYFPSRPTNEQSVAVYRIVKNSTYKQAFESFGVDLDVLCLNPHQIMEFCLKPSTRPPFFIEKGILNDYKGNTSFLFKVEKQFYVVGTIFNMDTHGVKISYWISDFNDPKIWEVEGPGCGERNIVTLPLIA